MEDFEVRFHNYMAGLCRESPDPAHDILHVERVVSVAKKLAKAERANFDIVVPAAYLHDCVFISKTDTRRSQASRLSADHAVELLRGWGYTEALLPAIHHAICAHSFSAKVVPETLEAKIVQDADRLDALGAIGIARCFGLSGLTRRPFYHPDDPFCDRRQPDDRSNAVDHFFTKLLHLEKTMQTATAKAEAAERVKTMTRFLESLRLELTT